ncbi:hypothetical protein Tco_1340825 [Tanacetum coccineum]
MNSKNTIRVQTCELTEEEFTRFLKLYPIPSQYHVILPKPNQTIFDAPDGYVGLYTHSNSVAILRLPLNQFFCDAYDVEPTVDIFRGFFNSYPSGKWLTFSKRHGKHIPELLPKVITCIDGWKGRFFFVQDYVVPSNCLELLSKDNRWDKKSFGDTL